LATSSATGSAVVATGLAGAAFCSWLFEEEGLISSKTSGMFKSEAAGAEAFGEKIWKSKIAWFLREA
jgi:hypothetical protein